jgi:hypothetical protein
MLDGIQRACENVVKKRACEKIRNKNRKTLK